MDYGSGLENDNNERSNELTLLVSCILYGIKLSDIFIYCSCHVEIKLVLGV